MAWGQIWVFLLVSYASLDAIFLSGDFSVDYVARNSNSMLPWYYKLPPSGALMKARVC